MLYVGCTPTGNVAQIAERLSRLVQTTATFSFSKSPPSWYHKIRPVGDLGSRALHRLQRGKALRGWKAVVLEDRRTYSSTRPPQWSTSASSNCPATTGATSTSIPSEKTTASAMKRRGWRDPTRESECPLLTRDGQSRKLLCWAAESTRRKLLCSPVCGFVPALSVGHLQTSLLPTTSPHPILLKDLNTGFKRFHFINEVSV